MADGVGRARGRARGRTREVAPAPELIRCPGDVPAPTGPIGEPVAAPAGEAPVPGIPRAVIIVFTVFLFHVASFWWRSVLFMCIVMSLLLR